MVFHIAYDVPISFYVDADSEQRVRELIHDQYIESLYRYIKQDTKKPMVFHEVELCDAISEMAIKNFDQAKEVFIEPENETLSKSRMHGSQVCRIWDE